MPNNSEQEFLQNYDPSKYPRPSVTVDNVIFMMNDQNQLCVLLVKRGGYPYKNYWALPGGFLQAGQESAENAAYRELFEETSVNEVSLQQLQTFSNPDRDPRTHVISIAYMALVPRQDLQFKAGDDAADARWFVLKPYGCTGLSVQCDNITLAENSLAFDHAEILKTALNRLRGRLNYMLDAFELLEDKNNFTIHELQLIHEAILDKKLDKPNFRTAFRRNYIKTCLVAPTGQTKTSNALRPAATYKLLQID